MTRGLSCLQGVGNTWNNPQVPFLQRGRGGSKDKELKGGSVQPIPSFLSNVGSLGERGKKGKLSHEKKICCAKGFGGRGGNPV